VCSSTFTEKLERLLNLGDFAMISNKLVSLTVAAVAGLGALAFNVELASAGGYGGGQGGRSVWSGGQGNRKDGAAAKAKPTGAAKATKAVGATAKAESTGAATEAAGAAAKANPFEAAMQAAKAAEAFGAALKALSGQ
jgi:nucleoid-associated protein YgaU